MEAPAKEQPSRAPHQFLRSTTTQAWWISNRSHAQALIHTGRLADTAGRHRAEVHSPLLPAHHTLHAWPSAAAGVPPKRAAHARQQASGEATLSSTATSAPLATHWPLAQPHQAVPFAARLASFAASSASVGTCTAASLSYRKNGSARLGEVATQGRARDGDGAAAGAGPCCRAGCRANCLFTII